VGEGEASETAGDRCQSVTGLRKGWAGHRLNTGTVTNWTRAQKRIGHGHKHEQDWARTRHEHRHEQNWARTGHGHGWARHKRIVSERHWYPLVSTKLIIFCIEL